MTLLTWDMGRPFKTATATFSALITRNENSPRWNSSDWRVTVNDRYQLGQEIARVGATDADRVGT